MHTTICIPIDPYWPLLVPIDPCWELIPSEWSRGPRGQGSGGSPWMSHVTDLGSHVIDMTWIYSYMHIYEYKYEYMNIFIYEYMHIFIYSCIHVVMYSFWWYAAMAWGWGSQCWGPCSQWHCSRVGAYMGSIGINSQQGSIGATRGQ